MSLVYMMWRLSLGITWTPSIQQCSVFTFLMLDLIIISYSKKKINKVGKRGGVGVAQVMGWMIQAVATDCFPQGCEADHSLSSSAEFKNG